MIGYVWRVEITVVVVSSNMAGRVSPTARTTHLYLSALARLLFVFNPPA